MQNIDNDMDELFNKAGREYPLKTDNSDWDAVLGKLREAETRTPIKDNLFNKGRYSWLLLLLLIPLVFLLNDRVERKEKQKEMIAPAQPVQQSPAADVTISETVSAKTNAEDHPISEPVEAAQNDLLKTGSKSAEDVILAPTTRREESTNREVAGILSPALRKNTKENEQEYKRSVSPTAVREQPRAGQATLDKTSGNEILNTSAKESITTKRTSTENKNLQSSENPLQETKRHPIGKPNHRLLLPSAAKLTNETSAGTNSTINVRFPIQYAYQKPTVQPPVIVSGEIRVTQSTTDTVGKLSGRQQSQKSKIYAGLLLGPDLSTIKYQRVNEVGYSIGLLAGYRLQKRISLEAGVLYTRKKYYSDGKYFDKAKAGISPSVYLESIDGFCEMYEIPLTMRYTLPLQKASLFASAGLTSYFMKKEGYRYDAYASGIYYEGHRSYKNSGNHFFSNIHLTVGYEYPISSKFSVRAEPYIKIPVNKIGTGNMPITSAGIYFGIMRNIR